MLINFPRIIPPTALVVKYKYAGNATNIQETY